MEKLVMQKIVVIGGGAAGCGAALELADAGHKIDLIESRNELLAGSSNGTPCRLGLGFHYIDPATSINYLKTSISFVRQYLPLVNSLRLAEDKPLDYPLRRGRYFIMKDSLFTTQKIFQHYEMLRNEYRKLVEEDLENQVFGTPENFYTFLSPSEYSDHVAADRIVAGIETAEQVLNWPLLKKYITHRVYSHRNIKVHHSVNVIGVKRSEDNKLKFIINGENQCSKQIIDFFGNFVVNSSWHNIEMIKNLGGFFPPPALRTNRVKVMLSIKLPEELHQSNSMFFAFGPHCSLTNLGNGTGWLTYEPVTNIESSMTSFLSERSQRFITGGATSKEKHAIANKILAGACAYIPSLTKAKFIDAQFGVVRVEGQVDIYSGSSAIHKRDKLCVESPIPGWIDNPSMKLLYFAQNAKVVKSLIDSQLEKKNSFDFGSLLSESLVSILLNPKLGWNSAT